MVEHVGAPGESHRLQGFEEAFRPGIAGLVVGQELDQAVPGQTGEKLGGRSGGVLRQWLGLPAFNTGEHLGHVVPGRTAGGERRLAAHQLDNFEAVGGLDGFPAAGDRFAVQRGGADQNLHGAPP